ncbi:MAG: hypothetical protein HYZ28_12045 [Myxococcales bacterium]|nr:hypothetical protein [Myxococcales bacterium]
MAPDVPELMPVSLEKSPLIEAFKKDVDRTLLRDSSNGRPVDPRTSSGSPNWKR